MKAYLYSEIGKFICETELQPNPMSHIDGEKEFLYPLNVTEIEPPETSQGEMAVFKDDKWEVLDDPEFLKHQKELEDAENARIAQEEAQKEALKKADEMAAKASSAKAKLLSLGLTEDEIKAMFGV